MRLRTTAALINTTLVTLALTAVAVAPAIAQTHV